jgi:hypothetical protein
MDSSYEYPDKPKEPDKKPCADCDLTDFDSMNCQVEGIAAEAEYMKKYQEDLKRRRTQFDTVRTAYDAARNAVAEDLALITEQLKKLRDQLECQLDEKKRTCLTDAWREVAGQLEKCGGEQGCCVTEEQCNFEWQFVKKPTAPEVRALIEDFERRVTAAEKCFDDVLAKEPDELKKRVTALKEFVAAIATAAADTKTTDYSRAFAELLWAEHRRRRIWLGFDNPNDFADCLCLALNCSLKGRRALAKLYGELKKLDCEDEKQKDRCTWLKANVVEEILAACRRICPPEKEQGSSRQSEQGSNQQSAY